MTTAGAGAPGEGFCVGAMAPTELEIAVSAMPNTNSRNAWEGSGQTKARRRFTPTGLGAHSSRRFNAGAPRPPNYLLRLANKQFNHLASRSAIC